LGDRFPPNPLVQNIANSESSASTTTFQPSGNLAADPGSSPSADEATSPDPSNDDPTSQIPSPNLLSRFFKAINPVSPAQAAEGEGLPMSPQMARALAEALHDSAAAAELLKTRDALASYHQAMRDALTYARNVPDSRVLGKLLERTGVQRPEGYEAHHIVAGNHTRADPGRKILQKFGININDPANGVFLPATDKTINIDGEAIHRPLHTYEYMDAVNEALKDAKTKEQAIATLELIGRALRAGGYP
jgi:hypothetical protein